MEIVVSPGLCNIQGAIKKFGEDTTITVASANATMNRIDTIVARLDLNSDYRDIGLFIIQGTPASVPTRPELTRNTSVYEIALADITIKANATSITQANISDTRLDTNRCGIISAIAEFDTTELYNQIQTDLKEFQESNELDFEQWFQIMKDQLSEDAAGNIQVQLDDHTEKSVPSENGAHGFRYFEGKLQAHIYDEESMTLKWVTVPGSGIAYDGEKSVRGAIDELSEHIGLYKKNYLPFPYYSTNSELNGVTRTINNDGTVNINGKATSEQWIGLADRTNNPLKLKAGTYIVNGCPEGGSASTYCIYVCTSDAKDLGIDTGNGFTLTLTEDTYVGVYIRISNGATLNNLTFKPMISDEGGEYEPYVADVQTQINEIQNNVMGTYYDLIANGNTNPDTASYKCEYDGYLGISTGNVATRYGISDGNNVGMYHSVNVPANQRALMYIKKGMRVYCEANTGTKCTFMPFIS
jgi:hypothetical protein